MDEQHPEQAREQARDLVAQRYPHALGAVLGGSAAAGRATPGSDLDIAVLLPPEERSHRATFRHRGRLAEVFLAREDDLAMVFEHDRERRVGTMMFIYGHGLPLTDPHGRLAVAAARARALLAEGPPALTEAELASARYRITDLADDLADTAPGAVPPAGRARHEQLAVAAALLEAAANLATVLRGAWGGGGKWLPRRLLDADPDLGADLLTGHLAVADHGDPAPLVKAATTLLDTCGGPLREGYVQYWQ